MSSWQLNNINTHVIAIRYALEKLLEKGDEGAASDLEENAKLREELEDLRRELSEEQNRVQYLREEKEDLAKTIAAQDEVIQEYYHKNRAKPSGDTTLATREILELRGDVRRLEQELKECHKARAEYFCEAQEFREQLHKEKMQREEGQKDLDQKQKKELDELRERDKQWQKQWQRRLAMWEDDIKRGLDEAEKSGA